ncbi:MAG: dihydropteroate synthase [Thermodesulfobacteriota bacterium]
MEMQIAADNLTITRKEVAAALERMEAGPIIELVRRMEKAGADLIDINSGPLLREPETRMRFLVETVQSATRLPLLLDTSNPKAIGAGLAVAGRKAVINGFSLEPEKLERILPLAREYEADIIGYLLLPNGHVPLDEADMMDIALALHAEIKKAGIDENRLIIDPVVAPAIWENGMHHNRQILSLIRHLPDLLGYPVRTIAGLSNLTAGPGPGDQKRILERVFLPMLAHAGLSIVLLNMFSPEIRGIAKACNALTDSRPFTWAGLS